MIAFTSKRGRVQVIWENDLGQLPDSDHFYQRFVDLLEESGLLNIDGAFSFIVRITTTEMTLAG